MFRQSPSRKRSNGFKVKHGLQIFLLVAICFWLLYQVKHSHDKKKAFDESSMKLSGNLDNEHEITKLGRKDLQPRLEEKATINEIQGKEEDIEGDEEENKSEIEEENKPEEEEEEKGSKPEEEKDNRLEEEEEVEEKENKPEEEEVEDEEEKENKPEEEEEENKSDEEEQDKTKHADEEAEGEETKHEENETQGRDDGIDEQDQETAEEEAEREEKFIDEEENSRKEEIEEGEKESKTENAGSSDDLDRDRNTQEAREENYKRDDASSAVVRESGNSGDLTEKELLESTGKIKLELNNTSIERITSDQNNPDQKTVGEKTESTPSINVVISVDKGNEVSRINSPITKSDDQQEESSSGTGNMSIASSFLQNGTNITSELTSGQTNEMGSATEGGSKLQIVNHAENSNITTGTENSNITTGTENSNITTGTENSNITTGTGNSDSNPAVLTTTEDVDVAKREFSDTSNIADTVVVSDEQTGKSISTAGEDNGSLSTETHENESGGQNEKAETTDGNKEADDSKASLTTNEKTEVVTNDPINHLIPLEEKEARTDLGTLPETETGGTNRDNEAVE